MVKGGFFLSGYLNRRPYKALGGGAKVLILLHGILSLSLGLSNLFVNLYLYQLQETILYPALYNLFIFTMVPFIYVLGGFIARRSDRLRALQLGVFFHALFYFLVLFLQAETTRYIVPLGLLKGCGVGLYHFAEHILVYDFTENKNRDYLVALNNLATSTTEMVAPFIGGAIISTMADLQGYRVIFAISFSLFLVAIGVSLFIKTRSSQEAYRLRKALTRMNRAWSHVLISNALHGFRAGSFSFLIALLVFFIFGSEFIVGTFTLGMGVLTLISSYLLGRFIRPTERKNVIFWVGILLSTSLLALILNLDVVGIIFFGILLAIFDPIFDILFEGISFKIIEDEPAMEERRIEYLVVREFPLNIGRVLGILLFLILVGTAMDRGRLVLFFLILFPFPILAGYLLRFQEKQ